MTDPSGKLYLFEHVCPGLRGGGVHVLPRRSTEDDLEHPVGSVAYRTLA